MNKRALRKLMAENDAKSPDILSALAYPETKEEACMIAGIFLDCTGYELPFSFEQWQCTIRAPTELYFVFKKKRQLMSFLKQTRKILPNIKIII